MEKEELSPKQKSNQETFLKEIGTLILKQSDTIKKQLDEHMSKQDEKLEQKIENSLTKINDKLDEKIKSNLAPLESRQTYSEQQIEALTSTKSATAAKVCHFMASFLPFFEQMFF